MLRFFTRTDSHAWRIEVGAIDAPACKLLLAAPIIVTPVHGPVCGGLHG